MIAEIVLRGFEEVLFYGLLFIIVLEILFVDLPKGINWILDKIQERRTKKEIEKLEMDSRIYHEWFEEHEEELYQKWIKAMEEKHGKDFKVDIKEEEL